MTTEEFAPEYSRTERIRFLLQALAAGAAVMAVCRLWLLPWLREFSVSAHCRSWLGIRGTAVLFHGLFVGLPLLAALLVGAFVGRRGLKVLREGRVPPAGEKVFRPTPVRRGARARLSGCVQLLSAVPLVALAAWGSLQSRALVEQAAPRPVQCSPGSSIEQAAPGRLRPNAAAARGERGAARAR